MRLTRPLLVLPLVACLLAWGKAGADVLPPQAASAAQRLSENPKAFDRVDNFCGGKQPGDACTIPGSRLAGGGEGVCRNEINRSNYMIDLSCRRTGSAVIDRDLPDGGFVADGSLCLNADPQVQRPYNCKPLHPTPSDRFCRGKAVGAACTVSMSFDGRPEQHAGVCRSVTQREGFYYQGRRTASREVVLCDAPEGIERQYTEASWWQKLKQ